MPTVHVETYIQAPIELCFDLSRSVEMHDEPPVAGVTSGLLELNDIATWESVHFGRRHSLTSQISEMERPYRFVDVLIRGRFEKLCHIHTFQPKDQGTLMIDDLEFSSPGRLARLGDKLLLRHYMRGVLLKRNQHIKQVAESDMAWKFVQARS